MDFPLVCSGVRVRCPAVATRGEQTAFFLQKLGAGVIPILDGTSGDIKIASRMCLSQVCDAPRCPGLHAHYNAAANESPQSFAFRFFFVPVVGAFLTPSRWVSEREGERHRLHRDVQFFSAFAPQFSAPFCGGRCLHWRRVPREDRTPLGEKKHVGIL